MCVHKSGRLVCGFFLIRALPMTTRTLFERGQAWQGTDFGRRKSFIIASCEFSPRCNMQSLSEASLPMRLTGAACLAHEDEMFLNQRRLSAIAIAIVQDSPGALP